jgi:hypothetical protein
LVTDTVVTMDKSSLASSIGSASQATPLGSQSLSDPSKAE